MLYEYEGRDRAADELAKDLLLVVAAQELSGVDAPPIRFSRSHSSGSAPEYIIMKRDDATVYIVTDDEVIEAGGSSELTTDDIDPGSTSETDRPENRPAEDLVSV